MSAKDNHEIASKHGFEPYSHANEVGFRKEAEDGSFWFAFSQSHGSSSVDHNWNIGRYTIHADNGNLAQIIVKESLPLETVLKEHALIPTPSFDSEGDGDDLVFRTFTEIAFHNHKGKPNWDKFERTLRNTPYLRPVFEDGWEVDTTGGGCTAFRKDDKDTGTCWYIAAESGVYAHPDSLEWCAQRESGDGEFVIGVESGTLIEAIANYNRIPVPTSDVTEHYRYLKNWQKFDEYLEEQQTSAPKP